MQDTSHLRSKLVMGASVVVLSAVAAPALAQTPGAPATAAAAAPAPQGSSADVIVTAEHRQTRLQKIPVAVSVFTGQSRDRTGIQTVQDVTNFAPGFTYDTVTVNAGMRGVTRQSFNVTDDSRVAAYEDEFFVYSPYNLALSSLFFSQEQIQRGPQNVGGRNSEGGSIDMIAVRPTNHPYAEVRGTVGNFNSYEIEGAASNEIAPNLNARIAGNWNYQGTGFYQNTVPGRSSEGHKINEWHIEGSLDWKPTQNLEVYARAFAAAWNTDEGDAGTRQFLSRGSWDEIALNDPHFGAISGSLYVNPDYGYAAVVPGAAAGAAALAATQGFFPQELPIAATLANPGVLNNPSQHSDTRFSDIDSRTAQLQNYDDFQGIVTYHLPGADLKYIGGVQGYDYTLELSDTESGIRNFTLPGSAFGIQGGTVGLLGAFGFPTVLWAGLPAPSTLTINPNVHTHFIENNWWHSHEVSIQSTTDSPFQYIIGALYYFQQYAQPDDIGVKGQANLQHPINVTALNFSSLPNILLSTTPGVILNPASLAAPNPNGELFQFGYQMQSETEAAYAQVSYKFNDQFKITGNLRFSHDRKYGNEEIRDVAFVGSALSSFYNILIPLYGGSTPAIDVTALAVCPSGVQAHCTTGPVAKGVVSIGVLHPNGQEFRSLNATDDVVTGGAGIEWTPSPTQFAYARFSRGYAPLSFNSGFVSAAPLVGPEFLNSYEVGYKQSFGRVFSIDTALFYYDYEKIQLPITVNVNGILEGQFINFPKAQSYGVEVEAVWNPTPDLLFTLSYSYDNTALLTGCNPTTNVGCLVNTEDATATGPGARQAPGAAPGVQTVKGAPLPNAPKNKIAITGAYTWHFDPGNLTAAATFIWRDSQIGNTVFATPYNTAPSWSDVDLRATWSGDHDRYEIIGYVRNVFNSLQYPTGAGGASLAGTNTTPGRVFVTTYNLNPPRTFGVELRYKFF